MNKYLFILVIVKEQRVDGSCRIDLRRFRSTLAGFERNHPIGIPSKQIDRLKRLYSSSLGVRAQAGSLHDPGSKLNPWFVIGFTDGEGCFHLSVTENKKFKLGWRAQLFFFINLNEKDVALLLKIKNFFRPPVGSINFKKRSKSVQFIISSVKDLAVIIEHFDKYPLITQKRADYELFKQAFKLMERGEHLTIEGLQKILAIKVSMNLGLFDKLKAIFPNVVPVVRPSVKNQTIHDPNW